VTTDSVPGRLRWREKRNFQLRQNQSGTSGSGKLIAAGLESYPWDRRKVMLRSAGDAEHRDIFAAIGLGTAFILAVALMVSSFGLTAMRPRRRRAPFTYEQIASQKWPSLPEHKGFLPRHQPRVSPAFRKDRRRDAPDTTLLLWAAIQASASASLANLLTVVGYVSGTITSTPNIPPSNATTR
jgi:hypothetical protein